MRLDRLPHTHYQKENQGSKSWRLCVQTVSRWWWGVRTHWSSQHRAGSGAPAQLSRVRGSTSSESALRLCPLPRSSAVGARAGAQLAGHGASILGCTGGEPGRLGNKPAQPQTHSGSARRRRGWGGLSSSETSRDAEDTATYITEHCLIINTCQLYRKVERTEYITFLSNYGLK